MRFIVWMPMLCLVIFGCCDPNIPNPEDSKPTMTIAVLVRNKAHSLPYFLSSLSNLLYPKKRIHLWLYTDYNEDNSMKILREWVRPNGDKYGAVKFLAGPDGALPDSKGAVEWDDAHMEHIIMLREKALAYARQFTEYLFMLDADVYLLNENTLDILIGKKERIVAPMLFSEGIYSNFWGGMSDKFYYQRTDEYKQILKRETVGCHRVPMVHSAVLVHVADYFTHKLTYDREKMSQPLGPTDDIISFALSALWTGHDMYICNDEIYGFTQLPVLQDTQYWRNGERLALSHVLLDALAMGRPLPLNDDLVRYLTPPPKYDPMPVEKVYLINLQRRKDRRVRMGATLAELQIDATIVAAVDGLRIDMNNLKEYNVTLMPGYEDPFHHRPMKAGEIGCFLSHYRIWEEIVSTGIPEALIFEDDVRFEPHFRKRLHNLFSETKHLDWNLLYLGRKVLNDGEEFVTDYTVKPSYSYWTLSYVIRQEGAQLLLNANPLDKMLPVDEFLPIMFNQHPNETWKSYFPERHLKALSAAPLLVTPSHYTGEPGYVSDTEDSLVLIPRDEL